MSRLFNELPSRFKNIDAKNRYHIIKAIENLLYEFEGMITDAENQYFFSRSSGEHLFNLATRHGFDFDNQLIYTPSLLRDVAPLMIYQPQQTKNLLTKILTAFYGQHYTHTTVEGLEAPYNLKDRSFIFETDILEEISFPEDSFTDIENVTADEFVQFFNSVARNVRVLKNKLPDNKESIYLIHKQSGFQAISLIGGTANSELQFGEMFTPTIQELEITKEKTPFVKITWIGSDPQFYRLKKDDYITIESNILNSTYQIIDAQFNEIIIRVDNLDEGVYSTIPEHILFQYKTLYNLAFNKLQASINETKHNVLTVTLPAAAPLQVDSEVPYWFGYSEETYNINSFNRNTLFLDSNIRYEDISFTLESQYIANKRVQGVNNIPGKIKLTNELMPYTEFTKVSDKNNCITYNNNILKITTSHPHFLHQGTEIELRNGIDGIFKIYNVIDNYNFEIILEQTYKTVEAKNIKATTQPNLLKIQFINNTDLDDLKVDDIIQITEGDNVFNFHSIILKKLSIKRIINNAVYVLGQFPAANDFIAKNITIKYIDKINSSNLEYRLVDNQEHYNNMKVIINKSTNSNLNSFVYDTNSIFTPTINRGVLNENVEATSSTQLDIKINNGSHFPDTGKIVLDYGNKNEELIDYIRKTDLNNNSVLLSIQPGKFLKYSHKKNAVVSLINSDYLRKGLPLYVNAPDVKRRECLRLLKQAVAAGVFLEEVVLYPEYINQDKSVKIFN